MPKFIRLSSGLFVNVGLITCIDPRPGHEHIWTAADGFDGISVTEIDIIRISDQIECIIPDGFKD